VPDLSTHHGRPAKQLPLTPASNIQVCCLLPLWDGILTTSVVITLLNLCSCADAVLKALNLASPKDSDALPVVFYEKPRPTEKPAKHLGSPKGGTTSASSVPAVDHSEVETLIPSASTPRHPLPHGVLQCLCFLQVINLYIQLLKERE
jgi:hypothetical protein